MAGISISDKSQKLTKNLQGLKDYPKNLFHTASFSIWIWKHSVALQKEAARSEPPTFSKGSADDSIHDFPEATKNLW